MSTNEEHTPASHTYDQAAGEAQTGSTADARQRAREVAEDVEYRARAKGEEIRQKLERSGDEHRERAAGTAETVAQAIRAAGSSFRDRDEERLGQLSDDLAAQVERFSGYLHDRDLGGMMNDLQDVAKHNPTAFLGGTLAAGLIAGRFLRASGRETDRNHDAVPGSAPQRLPSHREFASNSPTPELNATREAADSSSPTRTSSFGRETTYTDGGVSS